MKRALAAILIASFGAVAGTIDNLTVSPGTITFNATEPGNGFVAGSSQATVTISTINAASRPWTLSLQATSNQFSGCTTVPLSAVTVTCNSVADSTNGTRACSSPATLSTFYVPVASGTQSLNASTLLTVTLTFTFADNWSYPAKGSGCPLTIQYQASTN